MSAELEGQVTIVTGGGRGIGRAIARRLAAAGAELIVSARSEKELAETVNDITAAGGRASAFRADVTDRRAVERLVSSVEHRFGRVDLLVNNAGSFAPIAPPWEVDPDLWWRDIETNVRGTYLCARTVLPGMIERRNGRIINLASIAGTLPRPYFSGYACSKAGVLSLTESLAVATAEHGVSVFAINPGSVDTAMAENFWTSSGGKKWLPGYRERTAGSRVPPERSAELCVFLASGRGDGLSGRCIDVADDVADLVRHVEEIQRNDLYVLRLRK